MKVWVIMSNDYPDGVATTKEDRDRMLRECKAVWKRRAKESGRKSHVYVRAVEFTANRNGEI